MTATRTAAPSLAGVANFRDFGGLPTADGGRVRSGLLWRSGHLAEAEAPDVVGLTGLGIGHVADLRRPEERERLPTPRALRNAWTTLSHNHPTHTTEPPHLAVLLAPDASEATVSARMLTGYRGYPYDPALSEVYRAYLDALAEGEPEAGVLVHCHAGKDRTGFLVALTHRLLGVSTEALMIDYLRTNAESRIEQRLPAILETFRRDHGVTPPVDALRKVMQVEPAYLQASMASITARDGTVERYLERHLGVDPAQAERLRRRWVHPRPM
jgi:protein tyrosine/serine phosphatase